MGSNNLKIRKKRHRKDPRIRLREGARTRSIKKGCNFYINKFYDLKPMPKKCPILDIPLFVGNGNSTDNSPTLDRVGNEPFYYSKRTKVGNRYIYRSNVQIISRKANQSKSNLSFEEMEKLYFNMLLNKCSGNHNKMFEKTSKALMKVLEKDKKEHEKNVLEISNKHLEKDLQSKN